MRHIKFPAAAAVCAFFLTTSSPVDAGGIKSQGKMDVDVYGIITRALLYADDGDQHQLFHVDGGVENSRLGFAMSGQLTDKWDIAGAFEFDISLSNPAGDATLGANGEGAATTTAIAQRLADIAFRHKAFGTFSIGQGDTASTDRVAVDLSGSDLAAGNNPANMAGGINFYNTATGARAVTIGNVFDKIDGIDKAGRVRFDTPEFGGGRMAVSFTDGGSWDIGGGWGGKISGVEIEAAGFFANVNATSTTDDVMFGGSASAKLGSGLSLTVAGAQREQKTAGRDAPHYLWGKIGYSVGLTDIGGTHFGVSYGVYEDFAQNGDEATELGFGVVQDMESIGSNLWLLVRNHELDRSAASLDDIFIVSTGVLLNF